MCICPTVDTTTTKIDGRESGEEVGEPVDCVCVPEEWEMSDANFIIGFCCLQSYLAIRIALF